MKIKYWIVLGLEHTEIDYMNFYDAGMKRSETTAKTIGYITDDLELFFKYHSESDVIKIEEVDEVKYEKFKAVFDPLESNTTRLINCYIESERQRIKNNKVKNELLNYLKDNYSDVVENYNKYSRYRFETPLSSTTWGTSQKPTKRAQIGINVHETLQTIIDEFIKDNGVRISLHELESYNQKIELP